MHALALIYILRASDGVAEFKVHQPVAEHLDVQVVPTDAWDEQEEQALIAGLHARMGDGVQIAIHRRDRIPPDPSGKFRHVVSDVPLPDNLSEHYAPAGR
jgi:phenylacetate-CoA ligase